MDLIDEHHVARFEIGDDGDEIARLLERRTGSRADRRLHLVRDDVREGGLAESWRAEEQNVIESLFALARGLDRDLEIGLDFLLADVLLEPARSERKLGLDLVFEGLRAQDAAVGHCHQFIPSRADGEGSTVAPRLLRTGCRPRLHRRCLAALGINCMTDYRAIDAGRGFTGDA